MVKKLTDKLGIYEAELQLLLWSMLLLFIVSSAASILTNYADTVFLKRYGVEYLPVVNMLNAIATVVVMGFIAGMVQRLPGTSLLIRMFLFSGFSMALIRALIPFDLGLIYPLLFMLKAQFEVLLALLFWNMANDLFNTQQAKRLFPLLTAGGVIGQMLGSFGTPWFARTLSLDNLLIAYLVFAIAGAVAVYGMGRRFPTLLAGGAKKSSGPKQKASMVAELRRVWPMVKQSTLVKIMILLTFVPNVVIPILNYQFNYAVNEHFTSETGLLEFFGYMRGVLNIISLVLLLFVGKIYGRWGLPVALMFHPFNYVLAFLSFLFRFDLLAALYARMSTQILRTSINMPATAVLSGLFPQSYRAMVRPFLRGTVVRLGLFIGSTLILLSADLFHPRYLSLVAIPFILVWLAVPFWLKRRYTDILTDLVAGDMSDVKSLEAEDLHHLFKEPSMREKLRKDFTQSEPKDWLWYAQLLKSTNDDTLDQLIVEKLDSSDPNANADARIELMSLISAGDARTTSVLGTVAMQSSPTEQVAAIAALVRLAPETLNEAIDLTPLLEVPDAEVRAQAAAALLPSNPVKYKALIQQWIDDQSANTHLAGIIAAGVLGDLAFEPHLARLLQNDSGSTQRVAVLEALRRIQPPNLNNLVAAELSHPAAEVREAAVAAFQITDNDSLGTVIPMLGDSALAVTQQAKTQIVDAPFQDGKQLISALSAPQRKIREEIFRILDDLDIKDLDMVRFIREQAEVSYDFLFQAQAVRTLPDCTERQLLEEHLRQQSQLRAENILRVLATQDESGKMRIVSRGLMSSDVRQRANSEEALGDLLDKSLARIMLPLVDVSPEDNKLAAGKRAFKLNTITGSQADLIHRLLEQTHWVTRALALDTAARCKVSGINPEIVDAVQASAENAFVRCAAQRLRHNNSDDSRTTESDKENSLMDSSMEISEKILLLKEIGIFAGLSISELSAIAAISEEVDHAAGQRVIHQGDTGETMYVILNGEVAVIKKQDDGTETELDRMSSGDYFGEMALFENTARSASVVTREDSRLLFLHKHDFNDMVREYPQIALSICSALSGRIRVLHQKLQA